MNIDNARVIYFSPTGTSKRVVQAIAEGFDGVATEETDLTHPEFATCGSLGSNELTVIGVPVYGGRVPALAVERINDISGSNTPTVIVAVYGNREFEDALVELRDIVTEKGFKVVAAAAFIGEHSFSTDELPIGAGRPDAGDVEKAREFGRSVIETVSALATEDAAVINVPGNVPYKDGVGYFPFTPVVDQDTCSQCGICVENCPTGSIALDDTISITVESCILCASCVKICPEDAISLTSTPVQEKRVALNKNCSVRKEPQIFI